MVYIELITSQVKSRIADYKDKKTQHILPRNTTCSEELKSNMLLIINHELCEFDVILENEKTNTEPLQLIL